MDFDDIFEKILKFFMVFILGLISAILIILILKMVP
jgi:hypothetical protein